MAARDVAQKLKNRNQGMHVERQGETDAGGAAYSTVLCMIGLVMGAYSTHSVRDGGPSVGYE